MTESADQPVSRDWSRIALLAAPIVIFAALASVFFFQLISGRDNRELPSALIGQPVPNVDLPALEGLNSAGGSVPGLASKDFAGKVTLVNFFASWCGPCRAEHPVLLELAKKEGLTLFGVNYKDKGENARRFLGSLGNPYDHVGTDVRGRASIDWGFYGIPETFLIDRQGIIRHKIVGPIGARKLEILEAEIAKLIEQPG